MILPLYEGNTQLNYSNPKIEIAQFNAFVPCNRAKVLLGNIGLISKIYFYELNRTHNKGFYLKNLKSCLNTLILRIAAANELKKKIEKDLPDSVFYTFWFNQWTMILSLIKHKNKLRLVTRAHGSDYKEEQTNTTLLFRYFQLQQVNAVLAVSEYAKKYLVSKFKAKAEKIIVNHLGIKPSPALSPADPAQLNIVSCSSLIPLKRVHLLPEILKNVSIPASWTHFGNGPEMEKVKKKCAELPANINVQLMGYVPNENFLEFLGKNPVSFFMNVSEYEGLPVTLMEAISCGIPLVGCNICGVPEIVNEQTGFLIPANFDSKKVAKIIEREHREGKIYTSQYRERVTEFFLNNFSDEKNYKRLATRLANMN
jgi:glycosyltransferase involved in cell wall biosynthesis